MNMKLESIWVTDVRSSAAGGDTVIPFMEIRCVWKGYVIFAIIRRREAEDEWPRVKFKLRNITDMW